MKELTTKTFRLALDTLHATRLYRLLERRWSGRGAILMLHRVLPGETTQAFDPNRYLALTPDFLDTLLRVVRELDRDVIRLEEVPHRLRARASQRPFVCFTFDDGYRDVFEHALPVFARHQVPFSLYLNTGMPSGTTLLWWDLLEEVFRKASEVELVHEGRKTLHLARTREEKEHAFGCAYWQLRRLSEPGRRDEVSRLCDTHGIDPGTHCRSLALTWDMIGEMANSGLATIEAHTITHPVLSSLSPGEVRDEADRSRAVIAERIGYTPRHFAYPYGDASSAGPREFALIRDLGFTTATTTRKGTVFPEHAAHLHALPRISMNGNYQATRYVRLLLSGAPFAIWQRFRHLDVA